MADVLLTPNSPTDEGAVIETPDPNTTGGAVVTAVNEDVAEPNKDGAAFPLIPVAVLKPKGNTGAVVVVIVVAVGAVVPTAAGNPNIDFAKIIVFQVFLRKQKICKFNI